jgi:hypothetical protein
MASITLDGKRFVVYEVTRREYKAMGVMHYQTTRLRILELDHVVLFKRLLTGKLTLNRVNDPVVKAVVKEWANVLVHQYKKTKSVADEVCKQLNERNQND